MSDAGKACCELTKDEGKPGFIDVDFGIVCENADCDVLMGRLRAEKPGGIRYVCCEQASSPGKWVIVVRSTVDLGAFGELLSWLLERRSDGTANGPVVFERDGILSPYFKL